MRRAPRCGATRAHAGRLTEGGKLFRRQCLQCHNITGDGRGPPGLWVMPYPRDYRRGVVQVHHDRRHRQTAPRRPDAHASPMGSRGPRCRPSDLLPEAATGTAGGVRDVSLHSRAGRVRDIRGRTARTARPPTCRASRPSGSRRCLRSGRRPRPRPRYRRRADDGEPGSSTHQAAVNAGTNCSRARRITPASLATAISAASRCCATTSGVRSPSPRT